VNNARIVTHIQNKIETRLYLELICNKTSLYDITFTFKMFNKDHAAGHFKKKKNNCKSVHNHRACFLSVDWHQDGVYI